MQVVFVFEKFVSQKLCQFYFIAQNHIHQIHDLSPTRWLKLYDPYVEQNIQVQETLFL